jgi:hypothetical protein
LAISGIQPTIVFRLVATLCENGGTPKVMVRLEDIFVPSIIPHLVFETNRTKESKVWHVVMAKLHDLPKQPTINRTNVIFGVVVVHNEGVVQLQGALACQYGPLKVLLDSGTQPLMLGKFVVDGLGLTDADLDPCPYQILTSIGGSEKT